LKDELIDYDMAACDATMLQVLQEPDRPATRKSYVYCMRGGPPDKAVILYDYNAQAHKRYLVDWFAGFQGMIHTDSDPFFDELAAQPNIQLSYCNSHARRKFEPIAKATTPDGLAHYAMQIFQALYKLERQAKVQKFTSEQRHALRQEKTKLLLQEFKQWLDSVYPTVLPKSPLGKAIAYTINHWQGLICFLHDGRLEVDNNLTEQQIKPFVMARKNFLFACSVKGAKALCLHFSLIRTAKMHGLDPYRYYEAILKAIPYCQTVEAYEQLLPWNIDVGKVVPLKQAV